MLSIGIVLNATGESSGGILWPVPPRGACVINCWEDWSKVLGCNTFTAKSDVINSR
jgi:hypothetical protein